MANMLRMHMQVPKTWKEPLEEQDMELLQKEQDLVSKITNTKEDLTNSRYELLKRHEILLRQMREKPSFRQIMALRGQMPMSFSDFDSLLFKLPENVVWID